MSGTRSSALPQASQPLSLYRCSQHCLLRAERRLPAILKHFTLPKSVHVGLFVEGILEIQRVKANYMAAIVELLSLWPEDWLKMSSLFPDKKIGSLLRATVDNCTILDMIMNGLLNLKRQSKLTRLDLCCLPPPNIFHLPVLFLPETDMLWGDLINMIMERGKSFVGDGDDTLESVLSWKMTEISQKKSHFSTTYSGPEMVHITLENKSDLTEWVAMIDEIIGLCTQCLSPFRFSYTNFSVDNFYIVDRKLLKWLLSMIDIEVLERLYIYGKKRSIRLVMWELNKELASIPNLLSFGLGTTGPKIHTQLISLSEPTDEECVQPTKYALEQWNHLQNLQLIGLVLTRRLHVWLTSLHTPLNTLSLYACKLDREDLECLLASHHLANLSQLSLEMNDLHRCSEEICDIVQAAPQLELLNLRETKLKLGEKLAVIAALHQSEKLHTLAIYEQEDMLSTKGYESMVELACTIQSLKHFYVFPFNYKPFEIFYREGVERAAEMILCLNERTDMQLYY